MTNEKKERIKRPKLSNFLDKRKINPGRPSLKEIVELTDEMEQLLHLMARGMEPKRAGDFLGISKHKVERWPQIPLFKETLEKWRKIYSKEELDKWLAIDDEIKTSAAQSLLAKIKTGKATIKELRELVDERMIVIGLKEGNSSKVTVEEKRTLTIPTVKQNAPLLTYETRKDMLEEIPDMEEIAGKEFEEDDIPDEE